MNAPQTTACKRDAARARARARVNAAKYKTREQWLAALVAKLRPLFKARGYVVPDAVRVSCGWPATGGLRGNRKVAGSAWSTDASEDGAAEVFITPRLAIGSAPVGDDVSGVLVHELVHVTVGNAHGHGPKFKCCAESVGLVGKMTETMPGPQLRKQLAEICKVLGPYPHGALDPALHHKPQGTRMLKIECAECGWSARTTRNHIEAGLPTCHCGAEIEVAA